MWFLLLFSVRLAAALAFSGNFINPPPSTANHPNLSYQNGSIVQITWNSDLEYVALTMWPTGGGNLEYLPNSGNLSNSGVYPWLVGNSTNITSGFFEIYNPGDTSPLFVSDSFSIVSPPSSTTATSTATSISTISSSTYTSIVPQTAIATQSLIATQSAIPSSGLSTGATAGIGVGVGLGVVLLIAVGVFVGWRLRKNRSWPVSSKGYSAVGSAVGIEDGRGIRASEMSLEDMLKPNPVAPPPRGHYNALSELETPPQELGEGRPVELQ